MTTNVIWNKVFWIIIFMGIEGVAWTQSTIPKSYISIFSSVEPVDQRLLGIPSDIVERLMQDNKENPPDYTRTFGIEFGRTLFSLDGFSFDFGFRYTFERNTFIRPFNHFILTNGQQTYDLRFLRLYNYHTFGLNSNINYQIKISNNFGIKLGVDVLPSFKFFTRYK